MHSAEQHICNIALIYLKPQWYYLYFQQWKTHLTLEVQQIMRQGTFLEHLPQERVIMALTLTLVKGVCEQAPQLLRSLFNAALQFISPARTR